MGSFMGGVAQNQWGSTSTKSPTQAEVNAAAAAEYNQKRAAAAAAAPAAAPAVNNYYSYTQQAPSAPMAQYNLYGGTSSPAASKPAADPAPMSPALSGLNVAIQGQSGPTPGWADDPALAQTAEGLGTTTPGGAMGVLSQIVNKRGRMY